MSLTILSGKNTGHGQRCCTWAVCKLWLESRGQYWHIYGHFDPLSILQRVVRWELGGNALRCVRALGIPQWPLGSCHPKEWSNNLQASTVACTARWNCEMATWNHVLQAIDAPCSWNLGHGALLSWLGPLASVSRVRFAASWYCCANPLL